MFSLLKKIARNLHYRLLHSPRGGGKPVPESALDEEYRSGNWEHFFGPDEQARHDALVALIQKGPPRFRLLDLGCGSGRLAAMLDSTRLESYLGVDISAEGLARAGKLHLAHGRFLKADFETWRPTEIFDIITFNECLGYAEFPARTAEAFGHHLSENGRLIVSHFRWGNHEAVWRSLLRNFAILDEQTAANAKGQIWDLKVLQPRHQRP